LFSSSGVVIIGIGVSKLLVAPSTPESDLFGRILEDSGVILLSEAGMLLVIMFV
jgi:hypothetical protein